MCVELNKNNKRSHSDDYPKLHRSHYIAVPTTDVRQLIRKQ